MADPLRVLVGSLAPGVLPDAALAPPAGTVLLDLGPDHPSSAGLLDLRLWTEDGVVSQVRVVVGAMHRGAEKLFEVRDYRQILMLADRHDWQAPFAGELAVALACEDLMGLQVPERARWLRTLLAEHTRIASHLGFLGYLPHRTARTSAVPQIRDRWRRQLLALTGNRVHPMITRLGGLAADVPTGWLGAEVELARASARLAADLVAPLDPTSGGAGPEGAGRAGVGPAELDMAGVAPLDRSTISAYGVSGPAARASGTALDLRRQAPYLAYAELSDLLGDGPDTSGDAASRFRRLAYEVEESAALIAACADRLGELTGPIAERLPAVVRLPEGETYVATEAPLGVAGVYLVSRGDKTPWRLRLRTASFSNVSALEAVLVGVPVDRLEDALASLGYVIGDVDK